MCSSCIVFCGALPPTSKAKTNIADIEELVVPNNALLAALAD